MDVERARLKVEGLKLRPALWKIILFRDSDGDIPIMWSDRLPIEVENTLQLIRDRYGEQKVDNIQAVAAECVQKAPTIQEVMLEPVETTILLLLLGHELRVSDDIPFVVEPLCQQLSRVGLLEDGANLQQAQNICKDILRAGTSLREPDRALPTPRAEVSQSIVDFINNL